MVKHRGEQGVVSLITVMFFVILLSVVTVAFLRIMTDEQQQVIGDDLTKGALASAQSGVEDAKRALLYCRSLSGPSQTSCYAALDTTTCPGIFGTASPLTSGLGITPGGTVQVGGNPELNQRYTCLKVQRDTNEVTDIAQEGQGRLIEINTNGQPFDEIRLSWHRKGTEYDGNANLASTAILGTNNPATTTWTTANYPALLRVNLLDYDPAATLSALPQNQVTAFFVPTTNGSNTQAVGPISSASAANRARITAACSTAAVDYVCSLSLTTITGWNASHKYFIRLSTKYKSANYKIELRNLGSTVQFHDVQPKIDSTGAASDTYRRIISSVKYGSGLGYFTDNALETGESLCKAYYVTTTSAGNSSATGCTGF